MCYTEDIQGEIDMKRMISILTAALLVISGCSAPQQESEPEIETVTGTQSEIAQAYAQYFAEGNFDALETAFTYDEAMISAIENGQFRASLEMSQKLLGELQEISEPFLVEQQGYEIQSVPMIFENDQINLNVVFDDADQIAGVSLGAYDTGEALIELHGIEKELSFTARDGKELSGTLTLPDTEGTYPVVVLVHGSGALDRDEQITPRNKVFRDIAWLLAEQGVATYRYDKRTYLYGEELLNDYDFTVYDETVNDAIDAVNWVKEQENVDPTQVYVLGHSLGGMMIPAIAQAYNARGYIMMAAPVTNMADLIIEQVNYLANLDGTVTEEEKTQVEGMTNEFKMLDDLDSMPEDQLFYGGYKAYWESILNYDPIVTAESISAPVLVLQGEEDYQVPLREFEMWKEAFGDAINWEFHSYSGLTHLMQEGSLEEGPASYSVPSVVDSRVIDDIVKFIDSNRISH